jgi:WD40 repeat protein
VSSVTHSTDGKYLFSGSYDQTVKTWLGENGDCLGSQEVGSKVLRLAVSPVHDGVLAAGLQNGNVKILGFNDGGECHLRHEFAPPKRNREAVAVKWQGRLRPDWLIVGYDNTRGLKTGDLVIFDARAMSTAWIMMPGASTQFDIFVHEQGDFVTAGVASGRSTRVRTQVRVWDFNERRPRPVLEFDNQQDDINVVSMS